MHVRHNTLSRTVVSDSCKAIMPVTLLRGRSVTGRLSERGTGQSEACEDQNGAHRGHKGGTGNTRTSIPAPGP